jgi:hypothetical protein
MMGIATGHANDIGYHILTMYHSYMQPDPEDPNWSWPKELVPLIHQGCAIHLCIDTDDPDYKVIKFDPNGYGPGGDLEKHFSLETRSFKAWLNENLNWP